MIGILFQYTIRYNNDDDYYDIDDDNDYDDDNDNINDDLNNDYDQEQLSVVCNIAMPLKLSRFIMANCSKNTEMVPNAEHQFHCL